MNFMQIKKIAIVGGGTSGWLAANHLGKSIAHKTGISITLIESPDIPNIGVGEGTVPAMVETLKEFGISETDFIRNCDVTFKQSIKFVNWLDKFKHGEGNHYHHLFEQPYPFGADFGPYWLVEGKGSDFAEFVSPQASICNLGLAPKKITTPEFQNELAYAYHLNAAKFSKLLADHAQKKFGVKYISANVLDVKLSESGDITELVTDSQGDLAFDFFIDCSGFSSFLLGNKLGIPFVDKKNQLFIDKAIVAQIPTEPESPIPPYTVATAHQAGWIWDIALTERRGTGFVYSSAHMSSSEAEAKFDRYLGGKLANVSSREIPMNVGYREKFWHRNCVALGLAQGFVEPLEATAILVTDYAAATLAARFPESTEQVAFLADRFNERLKYSWDRVIDFIKLHYFASDRTDSDFWIQNRDESTLSDQLRSHIKLWESYPPSMSDLFTRFEVFNVENFLYVLYGMKFNTVVPEISKEYSDLSKRQYDALRRREKSLSEELPSHRELINKIKQYGLQKI